MRPAGGLVANIAFELWYKHGAPANNLKNTVAVVVCPEPIGQAQGYCRDPGARGKFGPGSLQDGQLLIRARIAKGTIVHADDAASWANLHERFAIKRINHTQAYSLDGARADMAEEHVDRFRRAEIGIHHHIAGACLRFAQGCSQPENNRRLCSGDQVNRIAAPPCWLRGARLQPICALHRQIRRAHQE